MSLEQRVRSARFTFSGRIGRVLYWSRQASRRPFEHGAVSTPEDLRLYERHQLEDVGMAFAEVENAVPLYVAAHVTQQEEGALKGGLIYYHVVPDTRKMQDREQRVGSDAIFFFNEHLVRFGPNRTAMPFPLYTYAVTQNWPDARPRDIEDLSQVDQLAARLKFRKVGS